MSQTVYEDYKREREEFLRTEEARYLGADVVLTKQEELVNSILMRAKRKEIEQGFSNPASYAPSRHFFEVLDTVKQSKVFQIIRQMPKGGVLHAHDTALLSTDKIVKLTYRDNLWVLGDIFKSTPKFQFASRQPDSVNGIEWMLIGSLRQSHGAEKFDAKLRKLFTLYTEHPETTYRDIDSVWTRFMELFGTFDPIVLNDDFWIDYYYESLKEFQEDNVQYLEFRGLLPPVTSADGKQYTQLEVCDLYYKTYQRFMAENPNFIGSKFIYAPLRFADDSRVEKLLQTYKDLKAKHPDYIAGFDLVGQEDKGHPLKGFAKRCLQENGNVDFIFHSGETNWHGLDTDENLIDAVLLGTKRIGHGFAAIKHPKVLEELKRRDIAIEVNPISNQVLKLVDDLRNHPAAVLFSDNYPVVVSSDDPSFWEAKPLSHDFYFAFMAIASAKADLRFLKKLALNSIKYSSMSDQEQVVALEKWNAAWQQFLDQILQNE